MLPTDFAIVVGMEGHHVAVAVSGRLDAETATRVRDVIVGILRTGHRHLVVDLPTAGSIDSRGLQILVQALRRCRSQGGELTFRFAAA